MLKLSHLPAAILAFAIAAPVMAAEPTATTPPSAMPKPAASAPRTAETPKSAAIDLNNATAVELKALPGMTEVGATKVIQGRPYREPHELVTKKIVSEAEFAKIKDRVVAKNPKS